MVQYIRSNTSSDIICGKRLLVGFRGFNGTLYNMYSVWVYSFQCVVFIK